MPLGQVNIEILNGQVTRPSENNDGISGILSYSQSATGNTFTKYNSLADIENAGITETSNYKLEWYQAKTFFEQDAAGTLWMGLVPSAATYDFTEMVTMQNAANGDIRNLLILTHDKIALSASGATGTAIVDIKNECDNLVLIAKPLLSVVWSPDVDVTQDNLPDLIGEGYNNRWLNIIIGRDGDNKGNTLEASLGYTVSAAGAYLGCLSRTDVAQKVSQPSLFNLTSDSADFINPKIGTDYVIDITDGDLDDIHDKGYIFVRKFVDYAGSFFSSVRTVTPDTDDFVSINLTRTVYKAFREVRKSLIPLIGRKIKQVNGKLTQEGMMVFKNAADTVLKSMVIADELTAFTTYISLDQDVVSTNNLNINITLNVIGSPDTINVSLGISA
jgi:hypothetical protein